MFLFKTIWLLFRLLLVAAPVAYLFYGTLTIAAFAMAGIGTPILLVGLFNFPKGTSTEEEMLEDEERRNYWEDIHNDDDIEDIRINSLNDD
jgi:hypothetical protein